MAEQEVGASRSSKFLGGLTLEPAKTIELEVKASKVVS
jgi:hypothetical protein